MTASPPYSDGPKNAGRDRAADWCEQALPVALFILFFTTAFAKVVASVAHSVSILLFLTLLILRRKQLSKGRLRTYYLLLLVYAGVMLLSLAGTEDLVTGFHRFRTTVWKVMIVVVLAETLTASRARQYLVAYAAGCVVVSCIAIYEGLVLHRYRPPTMWIATHGGNLLMFGLVTMAVLFLYPARKRMRTAALAAGLLTTYALYLNGTRGAWVAVVFTFLLLPLLVPRMPARNRATLFVLLVVAIAAISQTPFVQLKYREAVSNVESYEHDKPSTSVGYRLDMWKASIVMFREHPFFGVGQGTWHDELTRLIGEGKASPTIAHYRDPHNMFLDALSTQGLIGLAAFLMMIIWPVRVVWKYRDGEGAVAWTLLVLTTAAFVVSGQTDTLVYIRGVFLSYLMLTGVALALVRRMLPSEADKIRERPSSASALRQDRHPGTALTDDKRTPMRLLLLADPLSPHTVRWANALAKKGISVHVVGFVPNGGRSDHGSPYSTHTLRVNALLQQRAPGSPAKLSYLLSIPSIAAQVRDFRPDILHAHYATSYGLLGALIGYHPYIVSVWGMDAYEVPRRSIVHRLALRYILGRADKVLSTSIVMARETERYVDKSVLVTPFGVDVAAFADRPYQSIFNEDDIVIGTVKSLEDKYGIDYLIKAFAVLKGRHADLPLKLLIVGDGTRRSALEQLAADLDVAKDAVFTGKVSYEEVPHYHHMISVFAALSTTDSESFGVAIVEASAAGRPVVVSRVGGLPEVVEEGVTGLVVPARDELQAADAMERLVLDKDLRSRMGSAGRVRVHRLYDWNASVDRMIDIYRQTLAGANRSFAA